MSLYNSQNFPFNELANENFNAGSNIKNSLNLWAKECNKFWNFFYSFLIILQNKVNISDEEKIDENNFIKTKQSNYNFVNFIDTDQIDTMNNYTYLSLLLNQTQQFSINNDLYLIPQNFYAIEIDQDNIIFYCPQLDSTTLSQQEQGNNSWTIDMRFKKFSIPWQNIKNDSMINELITKINEYNLTDLNIPIFDSIIKEQSLNIDSYGLSFQEQEIIFQNNLNELFNNQTYSFIKDLGLTTLNLNDIKNIKNSMSILINNNNHSDNSNNISISDEDKTNSNNDNSSNNYLIYPVKQMSITQSYNGSFSHSRYTKGNPPAYPIDETGGSGNRTPFYCPCDAMKILGVYKITTGGQYNNTTYVWLQSTTPVILANGEHDYIIMECIHFENDDYENLNSLKEQGKIFKRKEKMFSTGQAGYATGNHIHMTINTGLPKNESITVSTMHINNGQGNILNTTGKPLKPEEAFFIDPSFTTVINNSNLSFKKLPN